MNHRELAFDSESQRTAAVVERDHQQRSIAVLCLAMAAAVVGMMAFGFHKSSATKQISVAVAQPMPATAASVVEQPATLPLAQLEPVVIRPTTQQLAEVEQLRKARVVQVRELTTVAVVARAAATGARL